MDPSLAEKPDYEASPYGAEFHALDVDEALAGGSAGPGKSWILLMDPILTQAVGEHDRCMRKEIKWGNSLGWALHVRREFPMLEQTISRAHRVFPNIDPDVHFDSQKHRFTFKSGYKVTFGHCANEKDWRIYFSNEYTGFYPDECTELTWEQYDMMSSRVHCGDPVLQKKLRIRCASNPGPGWVRERFVDPYPPGRRVLRYPRPPDRSGEKSHVRCLFLPATLYDNPDKAFARDYERRLLGRAPHIRQSLLYGDWYVVAGAFFSEEWNPSVNVIKPFKIPPGWTRFRSMDWGYKTQCVVLYWAVDPDENLICERELTFRYKTAREVARRLREIEVKEGYWDMNRNRSRLSGPADTQLWEERGESGVSKAEEMEEIGVGWTKANKKSRQNNAERVLARLKDRSSVDGAPGLAFFETCRMCCRTIPAIQSDPHDLSVPLKGGDDHWYDAVAYACAYRPRKSDVESEWLSPKRDLDDDEYDKPAAPKRVGAYGTLY